MRFALSVFGVGLLHFFGSFMAAFCAGIYAGWWRVLSNIVMFPMSLIQKPFGEVAGWVAWGLLSLGWGYAICAAVRHFSTGTTTATGA